MSKTKLDDAAFLPRLLQWLSSAHRIKNNYVIMSLTAWIVFTLPPLRPQSISRSHYFPATVAFSQFLKLTRHFPDSGACCSLAQNTFPVISWANSYSSLNGSSSWRPCLDQPPPPPTTKSKLKISHSSFIVLPTVCSYLYSCT